MRSARNHDYSPLLLFPGSFVNSPVLCAISPSTLLCIAPNALSVSMPTLYDIRNNTPGPPPSPTPTLRSESELESTTMLTSGGLTPTGLTSGATRLLRLTLVARTELTWKLTA